MNYYIKQSSFDYNKFQLRLGNTRGNSFDIIDNAEMKDIIEYFDKSEERLMVPVIIDIASFSYTLG